MIQDINDIAKYEESKHGYTTRTIHVGAIGNKLESLKATLIAFFDSTPVFQKTRTGWHDTVEEYFLHGKIKEIDYQFYVCCNEVPTPILMTNIHTASVTVPDGIEDELTPIIKREFQIYRSEVTERERIAEQSLPAMEAAIENAIERHNKEKKEPVSAGLMNRLTNSDEQL